MPIEPTIIAERKHLRTSTATSITAGTFNVWSPGDSAAAMPVAGAGFNIWLRKLVVTNDVAMTLTLLGDAVPVVGPLYLPAGGSVLNFEGRAQPFGVNTQPKITVLATGGGNVVATIDAYVDHGLE